MTYDPQTVMERYRITAELSTDSPRPHCSLLADGLPPKTQAECEGVGCNNSCFGLATVVKAAYELALASGAEESRDEPMPDDSEVPVEATNPAP